MPEVRETAVVDRLGDESEEVLPFRYSITSYGADYTIDGLVKRMSEGDIVVPTFQRGFVWPIKHASRFIESLLLGLPVPGILLSKEPDSQRMLVIDGQQRLRSLQYFYEGLFEPTKKQFALQSVQKELVGRTYKNLGDEDRRRLDDSILHATVVKQDEPTEDQSSIYYIFERINTGSLQLSPQEIRACIYHGEFIDLLKQLNGVTPWRSIYGHVSARMRDQELILRFLAMYFRRSGYARPMKDFLNSFAGGNRHLQICGESEAKGAFAGAITLAFESLGQQAFKPGRALNAAIFDAVMVGLAERLAVHEVVDREAVAQRYESLLTDTTFMAAASRATADEQAVSTRMNRAIAAFKDLD